MNQLDQRISQLKLQINILEEQLETSKKDLRRLEEIKEREERKKVK